MKYFKLLNQRWLEFLVICLAFYLSTGLAQTAEDTLVFNIFKSGGSPVFFTLDPADAGSLNDFAHITNLYETLYTYKGESITEFEPLLATDYSVSEDGLTYTYTLREGVTFHSGNTFSCKDVKYSIQRLLVIYRGTTWFLGISFFGEDYGNADGYVSSLAQEAGVDTSTEDWDPRVWEEAEAAYADYWEKVDNAVVCLDDYTVQFKLLKAENSFFVKMTSTVASILDSEWAKANGEWDGTQATYRDWINADTSQNHVASNVSGTGAYGLLSSDGSTLFLDAFADYWGDSPAVKTVQINSSSDLDATLLSLQAGDADMIDILESADMENIVEAKLRGSPGVVIHERETASVPEAAIYMFVFNQNINMEGNEFVGSGQLDGEGIPADFFSDVNVRRGFAYSYDPEESAAFYGSDVYQPTMALPSNIPGYDPTISVFSYDPEKAEEAFRAAYDGSLWDVGFTLDLVFFAPDPEVDILKANIEDLNPNFRVNVVTLGEDEYYTVASEGKMPIYLLGWGMDYPSADNLLYALYYTGETGNSNGWSNYVDEELNALLDAAISTNNADEAAQLWGQVGRYANDNALTVPRVSGDGTGTIFITRDNIQGLYNNPFIPSAFFWKHISKN
jgi:peptide/nickel transport system substrate-binding protein